MKAVLLLAMALMAASAPTPPLHAEGGQLFDSAGAKVRLECVSWSGAEQKDFVVGGLDRQTPEAIAQKVKDMNFNCVRVPWSVQMALTNPKVEDLRVVRNPELKGKTALDILDRTISALSSAGLMVVLDNHNSDANWCCSENDGNGLWHTDSYPESKWIEAWELMAKRYSSNPMIVAAEMRNEIRKATVGGKLIEPTWGGYTVSPGSAQFVHLPSKGDVEQVSDWASAAERGIRAVHARAPEWLVGVHGLNYAYVSAPLAQLRPIDKMSIMQQSNKTSLAQNDIRPVDGSMQALRFHQTADSAFTDEMSDSLYFTDVNKVRKLDVARKEKLMYVAHDFDWYHTDQISDYDSFKKRLDLAWGNTANQDHAPVWLSEFGTSHNGNHISSEGCFGGEQGEANLRQKLEHHIDEELIKMAEGGVSVDQMQAKTGMTKEELVTAMMNGDMKSVDAAVLKLKGTPEKASSLRQGNVENANTNDIPWQDLMAKAYTLAKNMVPDQRKPGRKDCWWPYLMRYLKEHPKIGYAYWRLDGTESNGDGRVFGSEESFGLLDMLWEKPASHNLNNEMQLLHKNEHIY